MLPLIALPIFKISQKQKGFTLLELIAVCAIIGVVSAVAAPNLIDSKRQEEVNKTFTKIRSTLIEAQTNANRKSTDCTVSISNNNATYSITGNPSGCVLEPFSVDKNIVSVTKSNFSNDPTFSNGNNDGMEFDLKSTTVDSGTLWIARKDFSGKVLPESAKCIVVSSIGMIRTGIFAGTSSKPTCNNIENKRYDNSVTSP
ncbi:Tfp pilus assembly protein FimT/FimU [Geminocystis sp.]|uniref:pilus assembly FimT family protein n=1 Tax=Geminocystis sp. TaxID=2664100 RepID=UPI003593A62B